MSTTDLTSLDHQLRQLDDRREIATLIARLGVMLDEKRFDDAQAILAADVTVETPGGSSRGYQAVVEQARRNHTVRTQHMITDLLIDLDGDHADARANLLVTFAPDSDQPGSLLAIGQAEQPASHLMLGERYRFEAARSDSGWRLTAIEVARSWSSQPVPPGTRITQLELDSPGAAS